MSQSLQDSTATVLDVLIQAGSNKLSLEEADKLKAAAVVAVGSVDAIDVTKPANVILSALRPMLIAQLGQLGDNLEKRATEAVESLDQKISKETMLTLWPNLGLSVKFLIWMLALATVACAGYLSYDAIRTHLYDPMDVAMIGLLPLFGLVVFCSWPIKTLAYSSMAIGAKIVEAKLQKGSTAPAGKDPKNPV